MHRTRDHSGSPTEIIPSAAPVSTGLVAFFPEVYMALAVTG